MSPQPSDPTPCAIPLAALDTPTRRYWVGCSGYFYRGWRGRFYPADLMSKDWLTYYAQRFHTVEINSTFYRFPTLAHLRRWGQDVPEGFVFALKAPRLITHVQRCNDPESVATLYQVVQAGLAGHLGAVLFQFPPDLHYQPQTLERVLDVLDPGYKNVLEFRHPSWWCATAYAALAERGVAFCSVSAPGLPETYVETAPFAYVRFHGRERWYASTYSQVELSGWAKQLQQGTGQEVFAYFNNDIEACAPQNALALQQLLEVA